MIIHNVIALPFKEAQLHYVYTETALRPLRNFRGVGRLCG
jgi:hypothetical protein